MTEQQIQKQIITSIEQDYSGYVVNVNKASKAGVSDLIACIEGRFISLEIKKPGKESTLSALQIHNLNLASEAGGVAAMITSVEQLHILLLSHGIKQNHKEDPFRPIEEYEV